MKGNILRQQYYLTAYFIIYNELSMTQPHASHVVTMAVYPVTQHHNSLCWYRVFANIIYNPKTFAPVPFKLLLKLSHKRLVTNLCCKCHLIGATNRISADKGAAFTQKIYTVFGIKVHFKDDPVYLEIGIRRTCLNRFVFYACALCVLLIVLCDTQLKQIRECQYIPQIST